MHPSPAEPSQDDHIADMFHQTTEERQRSRRLISIAFTHYITGNFVAMNNASRAYVDSLPLSNRPAANART